MPIAQCFECPSFVSTRHTPTTHCHNTHNDHSITSLLFFPFSSLDTVSRSLSIIVQLPMLTIEMFILTSILPLSRHERVYSPLLSTPHVQFPVKIYYFYASIHSVLLLSIDTKHTSRKTKKKNRLFLQPALSIFCCLSTTVRP